MLNELLARLRYAALCLIAVDGSWDMGAYLTGSVWPMGGWWVNERGVFRIYAEAMK